MASRTTRKHRDNWLAEYSRRRSLGQCVLCKRPVDRTGLVGRNRTRATHCSSCAETRRKYNQCAYVMSKAERERIQAMLDKPTWW